MDKYTRNARIYPMLIFYLPVVVISLIFSLHFEKISQLLISFGVMSALTYMMGQIGRDGGKVKEKELWASWGGCPSIQLFRWRNMEIDANTKKRYHLKMQNLCRVDNFPNPTVEAADPAAADGVYNAWTKYLISKTRDTTKYALLFKENVSYGFRRNLWGLKPYAISLLILIMGITYGYFYWTTKKANPMEYGKLFFFAEAILVALILLWSFIVTRKWIKIPSYGYAERLLETIESL
jgi:hypothetical protein